VPSSEMSPKGSLEKRYSRNWGTKEYARVTTVTSWPRCRRVRANCSACDCKPPVPDLNIQILMMILNGRLGSTGRRLGLLHTSQNRSRKDVVDTVRGKKRFGRPNCPGRKTLVLGFTRQLLKRG